MPSGLSNTNSNSQVTTNDIRCMNLQTYNKMDVESLPGNTKCMLLAV